MYAERCRSIAVVCQHPPAKRWRRAEVEQQADLHPCGFQVVDQLGFVSWRQRPSCFQLHDHLLLYQQIGPERPHDDAPEVDGDGALGLCFQPPLLQRYNHRAFVHRLEKAPTEFIMHFEKCANDLAGHMFMEEHRSI